MCVFTRHSFCWMLMNCYFISRGARLKRGDGKILPLNLGKITTNGGLSDIVLSCDIGLCRVCYWHLLFEAWQLQCFTLLFSKTLKTSNDGFATVWWTFPSYLGVRTSSYRCQIFVVTLPLSAPRLCNPGKLVSIGKDEKRGTMISVRFQWSEVNHEKSHASWCVPCGVECVMLHRAARIKPINVFSQGCVGLWPWLNFLDVFCVKLFSFTLLWGTLKEQPTLSLEGIESLSYFIQFLLLQPFTLCFSNSQVADIFMCGGFWGSVISNKVPETSPSATLPRRFRHLSPQAKYYI